MPKISLRHHLQTAIKEVEQKILHMSSKVDEAFLSTLIVIVSKDLSLAQQIIDNDKEIDYLQKDLEDFCGQVIATEQPVATDLRYLIASIKVAAALERSGDYARHICQNMNAASEFYLQKYTHLLQEMLQIISRMNKSAIDSFISGDVELAHVTADMDKNIDVIHLKIYKEIVKNIDDSGVAERPEASMALINIIRSLERVGDMLANISEHTIYAVTGEHADLN